MSNNEKVKKAIKLAGIEIPASIVLSHLNFINFNYDDKRLLADYHLQKAINQFSERYDSYLSIKDDVSYYASSIKQIDRSNMSLDHYIVIKVSLLDEVANVVNEIKSNLIKNYNEDSLSLKHVSLEKLHKKLIAHESMTKLRDEELRREELRREENEKVRLKQEETIRNSIADKEWQDELADRHAKKMEELQGIRRLKIETEENKRLMLEHNSEIYAKKLAEQKARDDAIKLISEESYNAIMSNLARSIERDKENERKEMEERRRWESIVENVNKRGDELLNLQQAKIKVEKLKKEAEDKAKRELEKENNRRTKEEDRLKKLEAAENRKIEQEKIKQEKREIELKRIEEKNNNERIRKELFAEEVKQANEARRIQLEIEETERQRRNKKRDDKILYEQKLTANLRAISDSIIKDAKLKKEAERELEKENNRRANEEARLKKLEAAETRKIEQEKIKQEKREIELKRIEEKNNNERIRKELFDEEVKQANEARRIQLEIEETERQRLLELKKKREHNKLLKHKWNKQIKAIIDAELKEEERIKKAELDEQLKQEEARKNRELIAKQHNDRENERLLVLERQRNKLMEYEQLLKKLDEQAEVDRLKNIISINNKNVEARRLARKHKIERDELEDRMKKTLDSSVDIVGMAVRSAVNFYNLFDRVFNAAIGISAPREDYLIKREKKLGALILKLDDKHSVNEYVRHFKLFAEWFKTSQELRNEHNWKEKMKMRKQGIKIGIVIAKVKYLEPFINVDSILKAKRIRRFKLMVEDYIQFIKSGPNDLKEMIIDHGKWRLYVSMKIDSISKQISYVQDTIKDVKTIVKNKTTDLINKFTDLSVSLVLNELLTKGESTVIVSSIDKNGMTFKKTVKLVIMSLFKSKQDYSYVETTQDTIVYLEDNYVRNLAVNLFNNTNDTTSLESVDNKLLQLEKNEINYLALPCSDPIQLEIINCFKDIDKIIQTSHVTIDEPIAVNNIVLPVMSYKCDYPIINLFKNINTNIRHNLIKRIKPNIRCRLTLLNKRKYKLQQNIEVDKHLLGNKQVRDPIHIIPVCKPLLFNKQSIKVDNELNYSIYKIDNKFVIRSSIFEPQIVLNENEFDNGYRFIDIFKFY